MCVCVFLSGQVKQAAADLKVTPVIDGKPVAHGELVGDALSVISLKKVSDDADPDRVVKRHSYRSLQRPDISSLDWVSQSDSKEEVCFRHSRICSRHVLPHQHYDHRQQKIRKIRI